MHCPKCGKKLQTYVLWDEDNQNAIAEIGCICGLNITIYWPDLKNVHEVICTF